MCGGIVKYEFVANWPVSLPMKELWKSVNIWGSYGQEFSVLFFWDSVYMYSARRIGDRTDPSLTPNMILKRGENMFSHFISFHQVLWLLQTNTELLGSGQILVAMSSLLLYTVPTEVMP